jgi:pilus assembly protein CpaC
VIARGKNCYEPGLAIIIAVSLLLSPFPGGAAQAGAQANAADAESPHDLSVGVNKSIIVTSSQPIERVSVGFGDFAEATAVGPKEVLVNGKAPGETSLIIWQVNGPKLFFDLTVRATPFANTSKLDALKRQLKQELPGQNFTPTIENETIFLRGTAQDLISADRAVSISGSFGKTVNLLYVTVPSSAAQILLKVQFASIDRNISSQLGMNLISTGATNTIGTVTTQQFSPATIAQQNGQPLTLSLSDALNIFLLRPDLNLAATIKALEQKSLVEVLAEPNVLAINGKQASFLAGGEFPYPVLQGAGTAGLGTVTIQFREFGVRINFIPTITPRGTILLDVAPEVSALDYANGLTLQGFTVPALTSRKMRTEVELQGGQSFAISGLLNRQVTETLSKIPLLGDIPLLGKIFHSRSLQRENTELLVIVTPEIVQPIPAGKKPPALKFPKELMPPDNPGQTRTPGMEVTGASLPAPPPDAIPMEKMIESLKSPVLIINSGNNITASNPSDQSSSMGMQSQPTPSPASPASPAPPPK